MKNIFILILTVLSIQAKGQNINELVNLGRDVNTGFHEAGPVISPNGKTLYFFVSNHPDNTYGKEGSQDIWFSEWNEGSKSWGKAQHMKSPLNNSRSNQVFTAFADGKTLLIRGGKSKNKKGFSFAYKNGGSWNTVVEITVTDFKKMNVGRFYGATMSSDKKVMILYFSEKENSAFSDLYLSFVQPDGSYSRPEKLGGNLNTVRDEFGPFLAPDDKTIYFASSRKDLGMGNADVYKVERLDNTWRKWSDPVNLGKPVNTRGFDAYFSIDAKGNIFTTSAGRSIDGGNLDIFGLKPIEPELKFAGLVMNQETEATIEANVHFITNKSKKDSTTLTSEDGDFELIFNKAEKISFEVTAKGYKSFTGDVQLPKFTKDTTFLYDIKLEPIPVQPMLSVTLYDKKTEDKIDGTVTILVGSSILVKEDTEDGYLEKTLKSKAKLNIKGEAQDYLTEETSIDLTNAQDPVFEGVELYLEPIEVGLSVRLNNIFFDFDKATLKSKSFPELDKVVQFLNDYPNINIEIEGHTDNKGSDDYNLNLSQERASAVMDYIVSKGINKSRIQAQGYGESQPVASNNSEAGRAENRRVVFTILSK